MGEGSTYEGDFYGWARAQATLLREGRVSEADLVNIAEEVEDMGKSLHRELESRLTVLLAHLLKWGAQTNYRGTSWRLTVREQRLRLTRLLDDNPSLRGRLPASIVNAFEIALLAAQRETGLPEGAFPAACPWTAEQILSGDFLPE